MDESKLKSYENIIVKIKSYLANQANVHSGNQVLFFSQIWQYRYVSWRSSIPASKALGRGAWSENYQHGFNSLLVLPVHEVQCLPVSRWVFI